MPPAPRMPQRTGRVVRSVVARRERTLGPAGGGRQVVGPRPARRIGAPWSAPRSSSRAGCRGSGSAGGSSARALELGPHRLRPQPAGRPGGGLRAGRPRAVAALRALLEEQPGPAGRPGDGDRVHGAVRRAARRYRGFHRALSAVTRSRGGLTCGDRVGLWARHPPYSHCGRAPATAPPPRAERHCRSWSWQRPCSVIE